MGQIYLYLQPDGVPRFMHCGTLTQKPPDEVTPLVSKTVIGYYQEPFSPTSTLMLLQLLRRIPTTNILGAVSY